MSQPGPHLLGRIHRPDDRDRRYLMSRLVAAAPVGKRLWPAVLMDQGETPHCVGYSCAGFMSSRRAAEHADDYPVFDADAIYSWANTHDGDTSPHDGSTVRAGLIALTTVGATVTAATDTTDDPVGGVDTLASYLWADTSRHDGDVDTLATWVLTVGPAVIGIPWFDSMFQPHADGRVTPSGQVAGGHAILVRGFNSDTGMFVLRNSWGAWGVTVQDDWSVDTGTPGGDCLVSKADMIRLLTNDGEAGSAVPDPIAPAPDPAPAPPTPAPVPDPPAPPPAPGPQPDVVQALHRIRAAAQAVVEEADTLLLGT